MYAASSDEVRVDVSENWKVVEEECRRHERECDQAIAIMKEHPHVGAFLLLSPYYVLSNRAAC